MILGLGEDLVAIERIGRLLNKEGDGFLKRCFTENEQEAAKEIPNTRVRTAWLAKRFAAKEALVKALGTGIRDGMVFADVETLNDSLGRPVINVFGAVKDQLESITPKGTKARLHITLTDEADLAKATVIIEAI